MDWEMKKPLSVKVSIDVDSEGYLIPSSSSSTPAGTKNFTLSMFTDKVLTGEEGEEEDKTGADVFNDFYYRLIGDVFGLYDNINARKLSVDYNLGE